MLYCSIFEQVLSFQDRRTAEAGNGEKAFSVFHDPDGARPFIESQPKRSRPSVKIDSILIKHLVKYSNQDIVRYCRLTKI